MGEINWFQITTVLHNSSDVLHSIWCDRPITYLYNFRSVWTPWESKHSRILSGCQAISGKDTILVKVTVSLIQGICSTCHKTCSCVVCLLGPGYMVLICGSWNVIYQSIFVGLLLLYQGNCIHLDIQANQLISPWTNWLPLRRQYFQMHFHEWKVFYFDYNFTEVSS